ncbi:MAG TPA: hypothetical protein VLQ46_03380 [Casimicrobiaceae bacterium]|nr:hypothetical protein [Casimicrobiaceae bacterium]
MKKLLIALCAGGVALSSALAFADDQTAPDYTQSEQAKMKQEADAKAAAYAKMTPEEKKAATKARRAKALANENKIESATQNPQGRNMGISKSAADSKAGPMPPRGTINTKEAEEKLMKNKGQ